ncbi:PQQ-dependent sugar dehydrogenase [Nocardiopsis changdeensis]|uniref:PQQ-dependent sugar dehydrogenase n=1 Tax=Nocardiopsis changdeensis TaxID=2831969 RepID=A0ABX8BK35_9ACTN|nr:MULTISPECIES: PQQ-dependent sugar dehydrogenase [Nocardiopsis]QUX22576.1 PQQ-dependent sugar dehydrogenase [Nocardiopsis changdeensis]QYX38517.1 PQQ-dependent sugar dehydrogenase [Nocardiopsis sp. MT53]
MRSTVRTGAAGRAAAAAAAAALTAACGAGGTSGDTAGGADPGAGGAPGTAGAAVGEPRVHATGLEVPWGAAVLPDGSVLVAERDSGEVVRVAEDGTVATVGSVDGVSPGGEGGLLGLAVDPAFPNEPYVYVYFTSSSDNRIARLEYDPQEGLTGQETLLDGIPAAGNHNGGRIAFGPDGFLYAGTGDAGDPSLSQDRDSLGGKILRITTEGEPAEDNPFGNATYSYGHRNVQGLAWDEEGRLYATEFGQDEWDEVNLIEPGGNYGWPEVEGEGGGDGFVDPLVTWTTDEASPSGAAVAGGSLWVASLRGARLWEVPLTGDGGVGEPTAHFTGEYGRLRTVVVTSEGDALWLSTSNRDGRGDPVEEDDRLFLVPLG